MVLGIVGNRVIVGEVLSFINEIGFDKIYICGREQSKDKLDAFATKYQLDAVYTSYEEFLKSDVDVVYIGVLNDLHTAYSRQALEAKKHVICEKPIVNSSADLFEALCSIHNNHQKKPLFL